MGLLESGEVPATCQHGRNAGAWERPRDSGVPYKDTAFFRAWPGYLRWDRPESPPWVAPCPAWRQPTALVVALDRLGLPNTAAVRSGLALSLFRAGSISVASAAQVAGLPLPRFLEILCSLKIPVVVGDAADLQEDLANARRWLNLSP